MKSIEVRFVGLDDGRTEFDEVVAGPVEHVHLEKMNDMQFWLAIETKTERVTFIIEAKRWKIDARELSRDPINGYSLGQRRRWAQLSPAQRKRKRRIG